LNAVISAFLELRDLCFGIRYMQIKMKDLVSFPIILSVVLITSSCGSSPVEEPVISRPVPLLPTQFTQPVSSNQTAIPVNTAIPLANRVAGRPGFVFNPYNQNMVEVSGISSGTKVRDPQDQDPSHIFVVP
jgi:hypothetical protein